MGNLMSLYAENGVEGAYEDGSEAALDPSMIRAGRDVEIGYFKDMGVYERIPQSHVHGKLIKTRWIYMNRGDLSGPI